LKGYLWRMARAIIRYSFDRDGGKPTRTEFRKRLGVSDAGFQRRGTASWETEGDPEPSVKQVLDAIRWVLEGITDPAGSDPDTLDHIWIYVDKGPANDASED
jgi:hypothetical protein